MPTKNKQRSTSRQDQYIISLDKDEAAILKAAISKFKFGNSTVAELFKELDALTTGITAFPNGDLEVGKDLYVDGNIQAAGEKFIGTEDDAYCAIVSPFSHPNVAIFGNLEEGTLFNGMAQDEQGDWYLSQGENTISEDGLFQPSDQDGVLVSFKAIGQAVSRKYYRHHIQVTASTSSTGADGLSLYGEFEFTSTSNLVVDSLQDLSTLLHDDEIYVIPHAVDNASGNPQYSQYSVLKKDNGVWKLFGHGIDAINGYAVISVKDSVFVD